MVIGPKGEQRDAGNADRALTGEGEIGLAAEGGFLKSMVT